VKVEKITLCKTCGKPTERSHNAVYCFPCMKASNIASTHRVFNRHKAEIKAGKRNPYKQNRKVDKGIYVFADDNVHAINFKAGGSK